MAIVVSIKMSVSKKDLLASLFNDDGIIIVATFKDEDLHKNYLDRIYTKDERAVLLVNRKAGGKTIISQMVFSSKPKEDVADYQTREKAEKALDDILSTTKGYIYWAPGVLITPTSDLGEKSSGFSLGGNWMKWGGIALVVVILLYVLYRKFGSQLFTEEA